MKVEVTFYLGPTQLNNLLRECDLYQEGEGVFMKKTMIMTLKKKVKITEAWKKKIIEAVKKAGESTGFEAERFGFKILV